MKKKVFLFVLVLVVSLTIISGTVVWGEAEQEDTWSDLEYYYSFDGDDFLKDSLGNGNDLVNTGNVGSGITDKVSDHLGKYAIFDGTSGLQVPDGIFTNIDSEITISTWVRINQFNNFTRLFDFGLQNVYLAMVIAPQDAGGRAEAFITKTGWLGTDFVSIYDANVTLQKDTWHHIALTIKDKTMKIYIDGVEKLSGLINVDPGEIEQGGENWIGKSRYDADPFLNGMVDDMRIYSRALTTAQILSLADKNADNPTAAPNDPEQTIPVETTEPNDPEQTIPAETTTPDTTPGSNNNNSQTGDTNYLPEIAVVLLTGILLVWTLMGKAKKAKEK